MSISKRGGDALQANLGTQEAGNYADVATVSASGNGFLHGRSGDSHSDTNLDQNVDQYLDQVNDGMGGDGGYDNTDANTSIDL
jgi:hypothetical protein